VGWTNNDGTVLTTEDGGVLGIVDVLLMFLSLFLYLLEDSVVDINIMELLFRCVP
jgi:hypothetical protein